MAADDVGQLGTHSHTYTYINSSCVLAQVLSCCCCCCRRRCLAARRVGCAGRHCVGQCLQLQLQHVATKVMRINADTYVVYCHCGLLLVAFIVVLLVVVVVVRGLSG